jgi:hypothetical protein
MAKTKVFPILFLPTINAPFATVAPMAQVHQLARRPNGSTAMIAMAAIS